VKSIVIATPLSNIPLITPNRPLEIWSEATLPEELEITGPRESSRFVASVAKSNHNGTSPLHPIELEDTVNQKVIPSSDSEDELPEVLSSKQTQVRTNTYLPASFGTQAVDSHGIMGASTYVDREAEHGALDLGCSNDQEKSEKGRVESQSTHLELQIEDSCYCQPAKQQTDESEIADEEDFDNHSRLWNPSLVHNTSTPKNYAVPPTAVDKSQSTPIGGSQSAEDITFENSQTNFLDINYSSRQAVCRDIAIENNNKDPGIKPSVTSRPPSPSDAALAKKAKSVEPRPLWPFMESNMNYPFDSCPGYRTQFKQTPTIGDVLPSPWDFSGTSRPWLLDNYDSSSWADGAEPLTDRPWIHGQKIEHPNSHLVNAFATRSVIQDRPCGSNWVSSCIQDSCTKSCGSSAINLDQSTSLLRVVHQSKEDGTHSSRLNISDIVHPQTDSTRNLKRKADEMSIDGAEAHKSAASHVSWSDSSQEALLDAQPRGVTHADQTVLFESTSQVIPKADVTVQQSPASESSKPPPQKRVKTSGPTAIGIGKFVSGVCFGVAGVFAAFIATIPLSVQEEAMQEFVKSV
jgi:hypothetical protein